MATVWHIIYDKKKESSKKMCCAGFQYYTTLLAKWFNANYIVKCFTMYNVIISYYVGLLKTFNNKC